MSNNKLITIVGAGISGIITAKVLSEFGHDVIVFEKSSEIGGVWARDRRYPGLSTQLNKDQYIFSQHPMPEEYPEYPTGEQYQAYLRSYVDKFGLDGKIRCGHQVVGAEQEADGRWRVTTLPANSQEVYDHLVVCTGVFSEPFIPRIEGVDEFQASGGLIRHTSQVGDMEDFRGKHVVTVGWGKSACDVAASVAGRAEPATTTVVARRIFWKLPAVIGGIPAKYMLGRLAEVETMTPVSV